jgi:hypothetical protein
MLYETQQFVSSIVYRQVRPPRLWWSDDLTEVTVDGETLNLETFRSGIRLMLDKAWELYDSITGGQRFTTELPLTFKDELAKDTHGYSFLSHGPFTTTPNALLRYLIQDQNLAAVDGMGRLSWNLPGLRRFFDTADQLNTMLSGLTFILPTISTRVTQFTDHKIRNDLRARNLHLLGNEMFLLARYHKMSSQTGFDTCFPAFYPEPLQDLTVEIMAGGLRDCEVIFSSVLYSAEAAQRYRT